MAASARIALISHSRPPSLKILVRSRPFGTASRVLRPEFRSAHVRRSNWAMVMFTI
jgi:hypothetical protein